MSRTGDDDRGGARGTADERARDRELPPSRLTDGPAPAPGSAEELVVAFMRAAKPYQTPPGRRQRLHAALAGRRRAHRPVRSWLKPALALGLLACAAATVSAHLLEWPRWLAERLPGHEASAARTTAAARSASSRPAGVPTPGPNEAPAVVPVSQPVAEATPSEAPAAAGTAPTPQPIPARSAPVPAPRHRSRASVAKASRSSAPTAASDGAAPPAIAEAAPAAVPARDEAKPTPASPPADGAKAAKAGRRDTSEEDAALALAALTALRRDHDPVRARAMVDAYLRAQPGGAMAEEALAIAIEAAAAHRDADAKALAARYLSLYPSGMFRALARKTLRADAASR